MDCIQIMNINFIMIVNGFMSIQKVLISNILIIYVIYDNKQKVQQIKFDELYTVTFVFILLFYF